MPLAILIGGPLDGQRVHVTKERPKFLEMLDDKGAPQTYLENDITWKDEAIDQPVFVHSAIHGPSFCLMSMLLAGYRSPSS